MPVQPVKILFSIRRNLISILFPAAVGAAIYADFARTRAYKEKKAHSVEFPRT